MVRAIFFIILPDTADILIWQVSVENVGFERFWRMVFFQHYKHGRKILMLIIRKQKRSIAEDF